MRPPCEDVRADLSAMIDGALSSRRAKELDDHLAGCGACRAERDALRRTSTLLAESGGERAPRSWVGEAVRRASGPRGKAPARSALRPVWALPSVAAALALAIVFVALRVNQSVPAPAAPRSAPAATPEPAPPAGASDAPQPEAQSPAPSRLVAEAKKERAAEPVADKAVAALKAKPEAAPRLEAAPVMEMDAISPAPVATIELSDIRFPAPAPPAAGAGAPAEPSRDAVSAPSAVGGAANVGATGSRSVRVRVRLDGDSRVVSAERAGDTPSGDDAAFIASLKGAVLRLPADSVAREAAAKDSRLSSLTALRKNARADAALRELLVEIRLPASRNP
ncbi:MAG: zf-HC2 domain-containing protein [Acidobacteria bacterium]|nr:zf-HC2 domain-containing protein [Acidobacteriota bacterium]